MPDKNDKYSEIMVTHIFSRHGQQHREEFETVSEALCSAYWGEDGSWIFSKRVIGDDGETVYDHTVDGNIFHFCEKRDYEWLPDEKISPIRKDSKSSMHQN